MTPSCSPRISLTKKYCRGPFSLTALQNYGVHTSAHWQLKLFGNLCFSLKTYNFNDHTDQFNINNWICSSALVLGHSTPNQPVLC